MVHSRILCTILECFFLVSLKIFQNKKFISIKKKSLRHLISKKNPQGSIIAYTIKEKNKKTTGQIQISTHYTPPTEKRKLWEKTIK